MTLPNPFRIRSIKFNDGSAFELANVTLLVGPNNCGKSRALKDTVALSTNPKSAGLVVVEIVLDGPNDWDELVKSLSDPPKIGNGGYTFSTLSPELDRGVGGVSWGSNSKTTIQANVTATLTGEHRSNGLKRFMDAAIVHLTTDARLTVLGDTNSPTDANSPQDLVQYFYRSGSKTEKAVSDLLERYFGKQLRLDFTDIQHLRMRYAADFSDVPIDPRDALGPMSTRELLSDQGDGVRSFTGMVAAIEALDRSVYVIDEPEAFLHPPQAFHIGRLIGQRANSDKQFIVATHSSDILRGVLSASEDISVVRVNRIGDKNSFQKIATTTIKTVTSDPLLSSSRVLEGLFYSAAVVVESDSDARFYAAALTQIDNELDAHFVAADNKQTVAKILCLYSEMGVKHLGIVDFDMLRVAAELEDALKSLGISETSIANIKESQKKIAEEANQVSSEQRINSFREVTERIIAELEAYDKGEKPDADSVLRFLQKRANEAASATKPWKALKEHGVAGLSAAGAIEFDKINAELLPYGLCIYRLGELESSLVEFGLSYTTNKKQWIVAALKLVSSLSVDLDKKFWQDIKRIADTLS